MSAPHRTAWPPREPMRDELVIAPDHRAFVGHFPGAPALPGIAQLWLAAELARVRCGAHARGARRVKFRAPIGPGARVALELAALAPPGDDGALRFELRRADGARDALSDGLLALDPAPPAPPPAVALPAPAPRPRQPDVEVMLPQRGPALYLVEALSVAAEPDAPSWLRGRVPPDSFLVAGDRVSAFAAVELTCQAGAVVPELRKPPHEPARRLAGALAAVKEAAFAALDFALDAELLIAVRTAVRGDFATVRAEVATLHRGDARALASIELTIVVR